MSDESNSRSLADLLQFAKDYASQDVDLYDILKIEPTTADKDIHRAWRRQNLKYHPDKTRENFDPVIYELVGRAKDILTSAAARKAYDDARDAVAKRRAERDALNANRRKLIDELEAAENAARVQREHDDQKRAEMEIERARMQAEAEEHERAEKLAEKEEKERRKRDIEGLEEQEALLLKRLQEKKERRAARKTADEDQDQDRKKKKGGYMFTMDPTLSYQEKVAGVLGKLRAAQKDRDMATQKERETATV
ncbi:hypothetical protein TD95_001000 [Thielaviopsis punctulata]|uniref:J domain-containing protein n=1 Tax=Thielaviopsis punctulata TaxID=72032 RepID=A0A0F4ZIC0_9PEZI|nr:hypothetical protein TD95_001008 [Thielaviopsis punctulata]KKA30378.1 hypothetical protein TD95_001000 [Thielaviopsis punctulata]